MQSAILFKQIHLSVCLSVRHTLVLYLNKCKYRQTPPSGHDPSFFRALPRYKIPRGTRHRGRYIHRGGKILRFLTEIAVCRGNGAT